MTIRFLALIGTLGSAAVGVASGQGDYRPTVQLTDLMSLRFFPKLGTFQFDGVQIAFPQPGEYSIELRRAGGAVVYKTGMRFEPLSGFPAFAALSPLERGSDKFKVSESGTFELAVRHGTQDLSVVTFEAKAAPSDDAYNPGTTVRLSGPWNKHAYLYTKDGDANAPLYAVGWLIDDDLGSTRADKFVTAQVSMGTTVLCRAEAFIDAPHWARYRFALLRPGSSTPCTLADVRKAEGEHRLEFRTKTRLLRAFAFPVAGGQIQRIPRNTLPYLAANWGGIPAKLVNTDLQMQELFWLEPR